VKGTLEAKNEDHAAELLNFAGYQLVNLKEIASFPTFNKFFSSMSKVKTSDVLLFYRQMALLIDSGMNIVTSIELLQQQTTNRTFRKVLTEIIEDIRGGSQMSAAMSKHPDIFKPLHCQSLKVGEQTGGMESILRQIADHIEREMTTSKGVKNAMMYPVMALIMAFAVIVLMVTFVLPSFQDLYTTLGAKMPALARMVLNLGFQARTYGIYILGVTAFIVITCVVYLKTASGRYNWDKLSLKFPVMGRINHLNALARFSRNVAVLFKAGLPLTEILPLVIESTTNKVMIEALIKVKEEMLGGEGLSRPMAKHAIFLPMLVQMVRVGEETGNLDNTMLSVAQSYEADAEDKTKSMVNMIQPVATIIIGLVVGIMALSMVSAMYSMYQGGI
jgi:type IV pilus assembly protein PilC